MRTLLALLALFFIAATPAPAAVLLVANNGLDGAGCGTKDAPCRSITRAIANAAAGDTIVVGPGRYGDLDRDGTLGEANEEGPSAALIVVDKAVTVLSRDGAAATIIDNASANRTAVRITASGARFGKAKKGFTLFDSAGQGVSVEGAAAGVVVEGNLAILVDGNVFNVSGSGAGNLLLRNIATAGGTGFALGGAGTVARSNLAVANTFSGFDVGGDGQRCEGNVSTGNLGFGYSFAFHVGATIAGGVAVGNLEGVRGGNGDQVTISGLAAIANLQSGVHNQSTTTMTLGTSNLIGNGAKALTGNLNCGTVNEQSSLTATNVFWGAATGPGDDPADRVCDFGIGATPVDPIAVKPFKVKTKVPQL